MSKKTRKPLSQRFCEKMDIPVGIFGRVSFIEVTGSREVSVDGCTGIVTYTDERIVLSLCDGALTVRGSALELHSFSFGRVAVSGIIYSISRSECCEADDDT